MSEEYVPADYNEMDFLEAKRFDKKVKENFMPAIISTVKQIIEDYGVLEGGCRLWHGCFCNLVMQTFEVEDICIGKGEGHMRSSAHEY